MKIRFAVAPDAGAQEGVQITAFADALEARASTASGSQTFRLLPSSTRCSGWR